MSTKRVVKKNPNKKAKKGSVQSVTPGNKTLDKTEDKRRAALLAEGYREEEITAGGNASKKGISRLAREQQRNQELADKKQKRDDKEEKMLALKVAREKEEAEGKPPKAPRAKRIAHYPRDAKVKRLITLPKKPEALCELFQVTRATTWRYEGLMIAAQAKTVGAALDADKRMDKWFFNHLITLKVISVTHPDTGKPIQPAK